MKIRKQGSLGFCKKRQANWGVGTAGRVSFFYFYVCLLLKTLAILWLSTLNTQHSLLSIPKTQFRERTNPFDQLLLGLLLKIVKTTYSTVQISFFGSGFQVFPIFLCFAQIHIQKGQSQLTTFTFRHLIYIRVCVLQIVLSMPCYCAFAAYENFNNTQPSYALLRKICMTWHALFIF